MHLLLGTWVLAVWTLTVQHLRDVWRHLSEGHCKYVLTDAPDLVVKVHEGRLGAWRGVACEHVNLKATTQWQVAHVQCNVLSTLHVRGCAVLQHERLVHSTLPCSMSGCPGRQTDLAAQVLIM